VTAFCRFLVLGLAIACLSGCPGPVSKSAATVTLYCALDRIHSQALIERFEAETGIDVRCKWDTEASKTTGLVNTLIAEASAPRCDVFWNNELSQTLLLDGRGLLASYKSPSAALLPASFRDKEGHWTGFAARARVFIVNTGLVAKHSRPRRLEDLLRPEFKGRIGIAKPLFGTTATHAAALFASLGSDRARAFFEALKKNDVVICAGNAHLKDRVVAGELAYGLTDTDDYNLARLAKAPVTVVFPDQGKGERGALLIPNSVALIKNAPHGAAARKLIDFILSAATEESLARGRSAQIPLRRGVPRPEWIPTELRWMDLDWMAVSRAFPEARSYVESKFLR